MTVPNEVTTRLANTAPFSALDVAERAALAAAAVVRAYRRDSVILEQGQTSHDHLHLVLTGQVRLIETAAGNVTRTFGEGKLFGHYRLLRDEALPYRAEALSEVTLALFPAEVFHSLCERHPRILAYFESDVRAYTRHHITLYDLSGAQFLFGTRLDGLIHRAPPTCAPDLTLRGAAGLMRDQDCDYLVVTRETEVLGLLTDRNLRIAVADGLPPETSVEAVMTTDTGTLTHRNSLFEALLMMLKGGLTHVLVRAGKDGPLCGVISDTDIARAHGYSPALLLDQINRTEALDQLAALRQEANQQLLLLYRRGVRAQDLITINTLINDGLTGRVLELCETDLTEPRPDVAFRWAWLSMGSEGRGEMSLKTDQDNALVYRAPVEAMPAVERWLAAWAGKANQALDWIGLSLCDGGMMAGNPLWRHPVEAWPAVFDDWLAQSQANQIMQVAAACDLRAVHGDLALEESVKAGLAGALAKHPRFLQHMAQGVASLPSPVGKLFGRLRTHKTEEGRSFNIKRRGLQPITDFARVLALRADYLESSNTFDRLEFLLQARPKLRTTLQDALDAYRHLNDIRLGHHLQDASLGLPPSNWISVDKLSDTQRDMLKAALGAMESVQAVLAQRL